jgi:hypothetical protein
MSQTAGDVSGRHTNSRGAHALNPLPAHTCQLRFAHFWIPSISLPHSPSPVQSSFVDKVISRLPGTKQPSKITHLEKYVAIPFYPYSHLLSTTRKIRVIRVSPSLKHMHASHRLYFNTSMRAYR